MSFQNTTQYTSFEKFLESTKEKLRQKVSAIPDCTAKHSGTITATPETVTKTPLQGPTVPDKPLVFDDFSLDDFQSTSDIPENSPSDLKDPRIGEQDLINELNSLSGKKADLWLAEKPNELLFAISLLYDSPSDNFIPRVEENDVAVAFLFYHGNPSNPPMVAVLDGKQARVRACDNHSGEKEIYSNKHEKKILLLPSEKIRDDKLILVCRFRSDITSVDEKQLNIFQSYVDFPSGRHVLFISPDSSAILSLKENAWWDRLVEQGRFHIVLCIRNISVGEFDSSSPIEGVLKNFNKQCESFYPGAWRHAIL